MQHIFIGGAQRTGTTLLQQILCNAPGTNPMLQEASYFRFLVEAYVKARPERHIKHYFGTIAQFNEFHASLLKQFLSYTCAQYNHPPHLVLKDPNLTRFFPVISELLPEAKFICMVRDPRDAIASLLQVSRRSEAMYGVAVVPRDVARLSRGFLSLYSPLLKSPNQAIRRATLFVRYVDLVTSPERALPQIQSFTGLDLSKIPVDRPLDPGRMEYDEDRRSSPWHSELYEQAISTVALGTYREVLTEEETKIVTALCRSFMKLFHFEGHPDA